MRNKEILDKALVAELEINELGEISELESTKLGGCACLEYRKEMLRATLTFLEHKKNVIIGMGT